MTKEWMAREQTHNKQVHRITVDQKRKMKGP